MTSELNGNGLVDSSEDAQAQAEQGGLVGLRGMKASPGRPNISAVLSRVVQEFSTEQEIGVVAAGALHDPPPHAKTSEGVMSFTRLSPCSWSCHIFLWQLHCKAEGSRLSSGLGAQLKIASTPIDLAARNARDAV